MQNDFPEAGYTPANLRHWIATNHGDVSLKTVATVADTLKVSPDAVWKWLATIEKKSRRDMPYKAWIELTSDGNTN